MCELNLSTSFYDYGTYPPLLLGIAGGITFLFGQRVWPTADKHRLDVLRRGGLFLVLVLAIGPGLIVNGGFKTLWGRPRPINCQEFGGEQQFVPVGQWGKDRIPNSSFPSGHAAIAFFFMSPGFLINPNRCRLCLCWFWAVPVMDC